MKIKPLVKDFIKPEYKRELSGGMDIYLQEDITLTVGVDNVINLGFAAEVPEGHVALLLPRSSTGMKGIALRNTVGVIDADYRGEWIAHLVVDEQGDNSFGDKSYPIQVEVKVVSVELASNLTLCSSISILIVNIIQLVFIILNYRKSK